MKTNIPIVWRDSIVALDFQSRQVRVLKWKGGDYVLVSDILAILDVTGATSWAASAPKHQKRLFHAPTITRAEKVLTLNWNALYAILERRNGMPDGLLEWVKQYTSNSESVTKLRNVCPFSLRTDATGDLQYIAVGGKVSVLVRGYRIRAIVKRGIRYYSLWDTSAALGLKDHPGKITELLKLASARSFSYKDTSRKPLIFIDENDLRKVAACVGNEASYELERFLNNIPVIPDFHDPEKEAAGKANLIGPHINLTVPERYCQIDMVAGTISFLSTGPVPLVGLSTFNLSSDLPETKLLAKLCPSDREMLLDAARRWVDALEESSPHK